MKNKALAISLLTASLFATSGVHAQTATQDLKDAKCNVEGAADAMKDYTFREKEKFTGMMRCRLARINRSLDDLDAKIDKSGDATKAEAKSKVAALREEVVHLGQQLDRVKNATETTWEGVKADSKNAYRKLSADVRRGRQWVSNKIAR